MKTEGIVSEELFNNMHQSIIDSCKAGDQKAQFQIYKLYYKAMYNTSLRIVHDTMDAEDIMQEAFLSAFDKINTYSGKVSFGSWLKKIVENRSLDHLRKKKMLVFENNNSLHDLQIENSDDKDEEEIKDSLIRKIKEVLGLLPRGCRKVFSMYHFEGFDHDEIGDILSISQSTSRSQYNRARKIIQNKI